MWPIQNEQLIASVSLAATFIALVTRDEAIDLLEQTMQAARSGGYVRLLANCYEILFVRKWKAAIDSRLTGLIEPRQ